MHVEGTTTSGPPWLLPGYHLLVLVRRLVITAVLSGLGYSVSSTASRGYCRGGISSDGDYLDHLGNPTSVVPSCVTMTLRPSPAVYLLLGLIVVWAVTRVVNARSEAAALRILGRTGPAVIVAALVIIVLGHISFFSVPLENWDGAAAPPVPGWLAVEVTISPMKGG